MVFFAPKKFLRKSEVGDDTTPLLFFRSHLIVGGKSGAASVNRRLNCDKDWDSSATKHQLRLSEGWSWRFPEKSDDDQLPSPQLLEHLDHPCHSFHWAESHHPPRHKPDHFWRRPSGHRTRQVDPRLCMNHSASREFLDGDKKFGLDRIGAKTLDDWRPHWTGSEQPQAGWGFVQYLERQSIGRSQNSPQAVLDYLLRKTDSSLPAIWSQEFRAIYAHWIIQKAHRLWHSKLLLTQSWKT